MTVRVLVVCTANVCRSPMAAALLQHRCDELGVEVSVSSAGVQAHQLPVDPDAVAVLAEQGLDISAHRPRPLDRELLDEADLVVTMTREHLRTVATTTPGCSSVHSRRGSWRVGWRGTGCSTSTR